MILINQKNYLFILGIRKVKTAKLEYILRHIKLGLVASQSQKYETLNSIVLLTFIKVPLS